MIYPTSMTQNHSDGYHWNRFDGYDAIALCEASSCAGRSAEGSASPFPASCGLTFRSDVGRVFLEREDSKRWHSSVSIAVFYAPFSGATRARLGRKRLTE